MNDDTEPPAPVKVRTLLCHRDVDLSLHCLGTLAACCADPVSIVIHEDGSLTAEDRDRIAASLPGAAVLDRRDADEIMAERLSRHRHARDFRAGSVWGLKLLDVALADPSGDCHYIDGDIRFFRPFSGLFCRRAVAGGSVFLRDTVWMAYSVRPWHLLDRRGLRITEGINTGLTLVDRECYDLDFVDWFLGQPDWRVIPAWTEPTCWSALARRTGGSAVDERQLPNLYPNCHIGPDTVGAHFLSAYRGRYRSELAAAPAAGAPVPVRFSRLRPAGPVALGLSQLKRKAGNELERRGWRRR